MRAHPLDLAVILAARFRGVVIALAGATILSGCVGPWERRQPANGFGAALEGSLKYGPIRGYVQTPRGGEPGTTSAQRPTLQELNVDDLLCPEASLRLGWRGHELYAAANLMRLDGESTLSTALVSQGTTFPAGASVRSEVQLDWYRAGYQYQVTWEDEHGTSLSLSPAVGVALLNFDYSLKADGGAAANRGYLVGTPQLGLGAAWSPAGRFAIAGGVFCSLPEVSNLFILSAQLTGNYHLWGRGEQGGRVFLGVGYDWLDYQDGQQVPNHVQANFGPTLFFGIGTRF